MEDSGKLRTLTGEEIEKMNQNIQIDVNKVATIFGKTGLMDYINKEVKNGNLVRIKNRSTKPADGREITPAIIARMLLMAL